MPPKRKPTPTLTIEPNPVRIHDTVTYSWSGAGAGASLYRESSCRQTSTPFVARDADSVTDTASCLGTERVELRDQRGRAIASAELQVDA